MCCVTRGEGRGGKEKEGKEGGGREGGRGGREEGGRGGDGGGREKHRLGLCLGWKGQ